MNLQKTLETQFKDFIVNIMRERDELTIEIAPKNILQVCELLRDRKEFAFDMLIDVCGVDYLEYGVTEWETDTTATTGYSRGVEQKGEKESGK